MPSRANAGRNYYAPADPRQIASSNATVHTLFGGRQPSWMTGGAGSSAKSTVPPHTLPSKGCAQPPAQVLPSPAPSDEPSPAVSNALDSPNPRNASLSEHPSMAQGVASSDLPVTDARFVLNSSGYSNSRPSSLEHLPSVSSGKAAVTYSQFRPDVPPGNLMTPSPVAANFSHPVAVPVASSGRQQSVDTYLDGSQDRAGSPTMANTNAQDQSGLSLKRRRADKAEVIRLGYSRFVADVDAWKSQVQVFSCDIEGPRLQLVREACAFEDGIFVALHQLFCIWSHDRREALSYLQLQPDVANNAFTFIEQVLKKNENMSAKQRNWFRQFPAPIQQLVQQTDYPVAIKNAAIFLREFSAHHAKLLNLTFSRRYPYLVEELLTYLSCFSPCLQKILFTASRRALGVADGHLSAQMEQAFAQDQRSHQDEHTGLFRQPVSFMDPAEREAAIKSRNASLISFYQQLVAHASNGNLGQSASSVAPALRSPAISSPHLIPGQFQESAASAVQIPTTQDMPVNNVRRRPYAAAPSSASVASQQSPVMAQNGFITLGQQLSSLAPPTSTTFILQSNGPSQPDSSMAMAMAAGQSPLSLTRSIQAQGGNLSPQLQRQNAQLQQVLRNVQNVRLGHQQQVPTQQFANYQQAAGQLHYQQHQPQIWASNLCNLQQQQIPPRIQPPSHSPQPTVSNPFPSALLLPMANQRAAFANNSPTTVPLQAGQFSMTRFPQDVHMRHNAAQTAVDPLLPPEGFVIPRQDWPFDASEQKAILMSLHQADARSPKRMMRNGAGRGAGQERHYQYVQALPVGPFSVPCADRIRKFTFHVTEEQRALSTTGTRRLNDLLPAMEYFDGSLRWRVRCCKLPKLDTAVAPERWSTLETYWPMNIFMSLNNNTLSIRRHSHNGKDLATELTNFIVAGENVLEVCIPTNRRESQGYFFLGVEELVTISHTSIMDRILKEAVIPQSSTLMEIKRRLTGTGTGEDGDDDGDLIFEASDLSVDLADPFSATIYKIPARGAACTHIECFDLETWLETRPTKTSRKCHHTVECNCPKNEEPSNPDKWKCPICSKDARPCSLRIDSFLVGVRAKLEEDKKLHAKRMNVAADGTWKVVAEAESDIDSDEDEEPRAKRRCPSNPTPQPVKKALSPVQVIILDDD